jgi:hypothetical protein
MVRCETCELEANLGQRWTAHEVPSCRDQIPQVGPSRRTTKA